MPLTGAAAARLYDDHVDAVYAMIARRVGTAAAPSITKEAFALALQSWDRFDVERDTERLFLYGAASTTLRQHADDEQRHLTSLRLPNSAPGGDVLDPLVSGVRQAEPRVVEHEANDDLRSDEVAAAADDPDAPDARTMRAVAALDPDDRDILLLSLWESCPQSAIAEALDLSVGSVRSALGRIRRELKIAVNREAT